jgi:hypothetical protein
MPKTAKRTITSKRSHQKSSKTTAARLAPQRIDDELPQKISRLGDKILALYDAGGAEDDDLSDTIDKLEKRFQSLDKLVHSKPVQPGDVSTLMAVAEIVRFWRGTELESLRDEEASVEGACLRLVNAIFSFCGAHEREIRRAA